MEFVQDNGVIKMIYSSDDELPENGEGVVIARAIIDYKNMVFVDNLKNDEAIVSIEELKNVINGIIEKIKPKNIIQINKKELTGDKLMEGFNLIKPYYRGNLLLINILDKYEFRDNMKYKFHFPEKEDIYKDIYYGFLNFIKIPVFASELVPKGTMLLFDNSKIGRLLLRKKYSIKLSESRFREIIRFEIENPDAVVMFKHEIKEV